MCSSVIQCFERQIRSRSELYGCSLYLFRNHAGIKIAHEKCLFCLTSVEMLVLGQKCSGVMFSTAEDCKDSLLRVIAEKKSFCRTYRSTFTTIVRKYNCLKFDFSACLQMLCKIKAHISILVYFF